MTGIILLTVWYVFMCVVSVYGFEHLDIMEPEFTEFLGPCRFMAALIWPVTWGLIGMGRVAEKIVKQIAKEMEGKK